MSLSTTSSPHEPSYFFPPVHPAPSAPISSPTTTAVTDDSAPHHTPNPTTCVPPTLQPTIQPPRTHLRNLSDLVNLTKANTGASIAIICGAIGVAAAIEDPSCLPQFSELGTGLIAAVCVGGVGVSIVALDQVGEGMDTGIDEAWGAVWRWVRDRVSGAEGSEGVGGGDMEETKMFDDEGGSVFLRDTPQRRCTTSPPLRTDKAEPGTPQSSHKHASPQDIVTCPVSPVFTLPPVLCTNPLNSLPSPRREENAHPSASSTQTTSLRLAPRQRQNHAASRLPDEHHPSGLLGASPVPPRRTAAQELQFKHFTGLGFHKHEQKLKAVSKWAAPGRRGRSFEEVLAEIEETDGRGERTWVEEDVL